MTERKVSCAVDINQVLVIRQTGRNWCYFGCGAVKKIVDVLGDYKAKKKVTKWLVITTKSAYIKCGAWKLCLEGFKKHGVEFTLFDKISPNPNCSEIDVAVKQGLDFGAQAVLAIGGGSPIDAAKNASYLLANKGVTSKQSYENTTICQHFGNQDKKDHLPLVVINTTHGTGTEVDMYAVVSDVENMKKPALGASFYYPEVAINDPELMLTLPLDQTIYTTIDAINHVNEACTTVCASPYCIMMGRECLDIIAKYFPIIIKDLKNIEARYYLTYAAMIAGICFDNGALHLTHALEHPLSAMKPTLAHGLGLAMILPAVNKTIWKSKGPVLADIYQNMIPGFTGDISEKEDFAKALEDYLKEMGAKTKLSDVGFTEKDIPALVKASDEQSLALLKSLATCWGEKGVDNEVVAQIYKESLTWLPKTEECCDCSCCKCHVSVAKKLSIDKKVIFEFVWGNKKYVVRNRTLLETGLFGLIVDVDGIPLHESTYVYDAFSTEVFFKGEEKNIKVVIE